MHRTIRRAVHGVAGIFLAAICVWSQASRTFPTQVQGSDFVAQESASGEIGRVYLFGGAAHTVCLDGQSGRVIWSVRAPGLSQQGSPGAGPTLAGKTLVYMGGGGFFTAYGLDIETGKTKWSLDKRSVALASGPGTVFLGTQGGLGVMAIDAQTGKIKWEHRAVKVGGSVTEMAYARGRLYTDSPWVWDANAGRVATKLSVDPGTLIATGGRVFLVRDDIPLVAVRAGAGEVLWKAPNPVPNPPQTTADDFLAASGHYVVGAFYDGGMFEAKHGVVRVYDAATGHLLWTKMITSATGLLPDPVSVDDQFVYLLEPGGKKGADTTVTAFDGRTGEQIWKFAAKRLDGPIAPVGGEVLVSSDEGQAPEYTTLYALDRKLGSLRWKFSFQGGL